MPPRMQGEFRIITDPVIQTTRFPLYKATVTGSAQVGQWPEWGIQEIFLRSYHVGYALRK